ncbi:MAG: hypothetical protein WC794_03915 [Candidatus Doudnabacteria bacterium]|jgi:hypothetical protein
MGTPDNKSGYLSNEMNPNPYVREPLSTARAVEFNDKLDALWVRTSDGKEKRMLKPKERAVLSGLYVNARILQDKLIEHNDDYSKCMGSVAVCLGFLQQAKELGEKNGVPFLAEEAKAILERFDLPEK